MPAKSDDLDLDLDLDIGTRAGLGGGLRYNTEDYAKLIPHTVSVRVPANTYSADWDPENRAWAYV